MAIDFWDQPASAAGGTAPPPSGEGPTYLSNSWDVVFLNGQPLPGLCKVKGLPTLSVDTKKATGSDGATITVNGYLPGPIELELMMWTVEQWEFFQALVPTLWRKPNKKSKLKELAIPISHPALDLWAISQVVILGVSVPEDGPVPQSKVIKIKAIEYVPSTTTKRTTTAKAGPEVPQTKEHLLRKNSGGEPPSVTSVGPRGEPKNTSPTSS